MPPHTVAAGHRRNRHHLSVPDQPDATSRRVILPSNWEWFSMCRFPQCTAHEPPLRSITAPSDGRRAPDRGSPSGDGHAPAGTNDPQNGHDDNFLVDITSTTNSAGVSTTTPVTPTPRRCNRTRITSKLIEASWIGDFYFTTYSSEASTPKQGPHPYPNPNISRSLDLGTCN